MAALSSLALTFPFPAPLSLANYQYGWQNVENTAALTSLAHTCLPVLSLAVPLHSSPLLHLSSYYSF